MKNYNDVEDIINNETVLSILNNARLPEEEKLLLKIIEKNEDKEVYEIYATYKESLNYMCSMEKKIGKVNSWHLKFKMNLKFRSSPF